MAFRRSTVRSRSAPPMKSKAYEVKSGFASLFFAFDSNSDSNRVQNRFLGRPSYRSNHRLTRACCVIGLRESKTSRCFSDTSPYASPRRTTHTGSRRGANGPKSACANCGDESPVDCWSDSTARGSVHEHTCYDLPEPRLPTSKTTKLSDPSNTIGSALPFSAKDLATVERGSAVLKALDGLSGPEPERCNVVEHL